MVHSWTDIHCLKFKTNQVYIYNNKLLNIHQQDFCESYFPLKITVYWLVTQSKVTCFPRFVYSPSLLSNTNGAGMFSYSAHFLSQVRHCKADNLVPRAFFSKNGLGRERALASAGHVYSLNIPEKLIYMQPAGFALTEVERSNNGK